MSKTFNELKQSLTESDIDEIMSIVCKGCRENTRRRVRSILTYGPSTIGSYGILGRLVKEDRGWVYIAGQSYPDEIRTVRECILGKV